MSQGLKWTALVVLTAVLLAILAVLALLLTNGVSLEVRVVSQSDPMQVSLSDPIGVRVTEPVVLAVSGVETSAIPLQFDITDIPQCPQCGGSLLLKSYSVWTGELEWFCPVCDGVVGPLP